MRRTIPGERAPDRRGFFPSVAEVAQRLRHAYPNTNLGNKRNPLNEVAYIILSGQTGGELTQEAYASFKRQFPRWDRVADAPLSAIAASIRIGGLGQQKARYLRDIARRLRQDFGAVTLNALTRMSTALAEKYLCSLPGVGIKTARCVLLYSLNRRVFPADTHCLRVMTRLGWVNWERQRGEALADVAQQGVPPPVRRLLHIRFVQHGRAVCRARPLCSQCVLNTRCPSAENTR